MTDYGRLQSLDNDARLLGYFDRTEVNKDNEFWNERLRRRKEWERQQKNNSPVPVQDINDD